MAMNNHERIFKAFDLLAEGLNDTVDEVMTEAFETPDWHLKWAAEDAAKAGKRGLWRDAEPVPPWDFRHNKSKS